MSTVTARIQFLFAQLCYESLLVVQSVACIMVCITDLQKKVSKYKNHTLKYHVIWVFGRSSSLALSLSLYIYIYIYIYICIYIYTHLKRPHSDLTGMVVRRGNYPQMASIQIGELT